MEKQRLGGEVIAIAAQTAVNRMDDERASAVRHSCDESAGLEAAASIAGGEDEIMSRCDDQRTTMP